MGSAGFWGLKIASGKLYEHKVDTPFRVSMASLTKTIKSNSRSCVLVKVDNVEYTLCALTPDKAEQQLLDFIFSSGEKISFWVEGANDVDLTGNYIAEDVFYGGSDEESDSEVSEKGEEQKSLATYRDLIGKVAEEEMESDDDPEYVDGQSEEESDEEINGREETSEDDGSESSEDVGLMEEDLEQAKHSKSEREEARKRQDFQKSPNGTPAKKVRFSEETPPANKKVKENRQSKMGSKSPKPAKEGKRETPIPEDEAKDLDTLTKNDKTSETPKKEEANSQITQISNLGTTRALANGLVIEDLVTVKGKSAIIEGGCVVSVRYSGRLKENGQEFDQNFKGKRRPLKFVVGKGQVIEGWEKGVLGMRAGDQCKLTVPPELAYGKKGMPPKIPPNATLEFHIKILKVQKK